MGSTTPFVKESVEFEELNLHISKHEFESARPDGRTASINRSHWVARFNRICMLVNEYHRGGPILEIGAYRYNLTKILELKGYSVVGVDKDVSKMSEYIEKEGFDIRECDIEREDLPFEDNSFSTIVLTEVFEHLRIDPLNVLRNIRRVVSNDGFLLLTTPNLYYIMNIVDYLFGRGIRTMYDGYEEFKQLEEEGFPGHIRIYTMSEMKKFLENTGFKIVETRYAGLPRGKKSKFLRPVCKFKPNLMRTMYIVATPRE